MTPPRHVWVRPRFDTVDRPGLWLHTRDVVGEGGLVREVLVTFWVEEEDRAVTVWVPSSSVRPV